MTDPKDFTALAKSHVENKDFGAKDMVYGMECLDQ